MGRRIILIAAILSAISFSAVVTAQIQFTDITDFAGVGGPTGYEAGGHGSMWADVNGDGLPDLYMPFNGQEMLYFDQFYLNLGGGLFLEQAGSLGIADPDGGSHGAVWCDLDNDGDYDLVNGTTYGFGGAGAQNDAFRNNGIGVFHEVIIPDMESAQEATRAIAAFDMEGDGDLDLFCVSGFLGTNDPEEERNEVYINQGGFQFQAQTTGVLCDAPAGQGALDSDIDGDGDIDLLIGNRTGPLNMLLNNGSGVFTSVDPSSRGITHLARDGVTPGDVDNDGDLDLLLDEDGVSFLYLNDGDGTFTYSYSNSQPGYMGSFGDLDNDGDLDLVLAGDNTIKINDGSGNFTEGPAVPNWEHPDMRGVSLADFDNDGDLDFLYVGKSAPNRLYRNDYSGANNWLKIKLRSPLGQAGAFGAKIHIYPSGQSGGALLAFREARSNYGYLAQDDPVIHVGLGSRSSVDVVVTFLDGFTLTLDSVSANQTVFADALPPVFRDAFDGPRRNISRYPW